MFKTIKHYEETGLGLPYPIVLIDGAEEEVDDVTGETVGISIPDLEQLVVSVAIARVLHPMQLAGVEVRFIREVLGMNATTFAGVLDVDKSTLSRWENGKHECGEWADKQVRQIAVIMLANKVPCLSLNPKAVVGMRIQKAAPGSWPHIEMQRVHVHGSSQGCGEGEAWDALPLAA